MLFPLDESDHPTYRSVTFERLVIEEETEKFLCQLNSQLNQLLAMEPLRVAKLPVEIPQEGVYLFSSGAEHLFAGQSDNLPKSIKVTCQKNAPYAATRFANNLARYGGGETHTNEVRLFAMDLIKNVCDLRIISEPDETARACLLAYIMEELRPKFNHQ